MSAVKFVNIIPKGISLTQIGIYYKSVGRINELSKNSATPNSINKARILSPKVLSECDLFLSAKSSFIVKK